MNVQRARMYETLAELKRHACFTVVGGPWVTVKVDDIAGVADVIFVSEAEETWPRFLSRRYGLSVLSAVLDAKDWSGSAQAETLLTRARECALGIAVDASTYLSRWQALRSGDNASSASAPTTAA
jgi:hypothetical protein